MSRTTLRTHEDIVAISYCQKDQYKSSFVSFISNKFTSSYILKYKLIMLARHGGMSWREPKHHKHHFFLCVSSALYWPRG